LTTSFELGARSFAAFADTFDEVTSKCFRDAMKCAIEEGRVDPFKIMTSSNVQDAAEELKRIMHKLESETASNFKKLLGPQVRKDVRYYRSTKTCHENYQRSL